MKIAFAIHSLSGGGAERVISVLASRFAEKGYGVHLINNVHSDTEYSLNKKVVRHFIGENVSSSRIVSFFQRINRFRTICKMNNYDVLITFMGMNEYGIYATFGLRTKLIISVRNAVDRLYPTPIKRFIRLNFLSLAAGAVFQTDEAKGWFPKRLQRRGKIILNPVWGNFYGVKREPQPGLLVATGRLIPQKNYQMMLKAVSLVAHKYDVRLSIYGRGHDQDMLLKYAQNLGISDRVIFEGFCSDMPSALSKADIYLMTSDFEGLPNALMEAMAVGVPCVATNCLGGGPRMLLGDNKRGLLCKCGDSRALADAIESLLENQEKKENMGIAASEYAKGFSIDNCFNDWEQYIKSIVI